ncbi:MAG: J domain-containing protein [Akkermansiaceae bacterium]|nr:J domain-containing protein [Akkermansiaceae bacterium]
MNPFEILGMEPRLVLDREELNQAFREAGKSSHPDAGGSEEGFAELQAAQAMLQSPARRLKAWLEVRGLEVESRGSIGPELMDEFGRVGEVTQQAEAIIRKREAAQSALAKAMLEGETHVCREALEKAMMRIEVLIEQSCAGFESLETGGKVDIAKASQWVRDLSFLEKWQASLRALYAKML